ncbi:MAG: hypothetical protein WCK15_24505, partial [Pirellula sp.]
PSGRTVVSQTIATLNSWITDPSHPPDFVRAARIVLQRIEALGVGNSSTYDIKQTFIFTDGSQPLDTGISSHSLLEFVLIWEGGELDNSSRVLLSKWETVPSLEDAVRQLRSTLDGHANKFQSIFEAMRTSSFWSFEFNAGFPTPLVWRKHSSLPFIQSLPLTQTLSPPNHPSNSRQLAPFALEYESIAPEPKGWIFGQSSASDFDNASRRWGEYLGTLALAKEWKDAGPGKAGFRFLPMVSLSIPGITAHPIARGPEAPLSDPSGSVLPLQWSHGLPYLDEQHALAQLPREDGVTETAAGMSANPGQSVDFRQGDQAGAARPVPLKRETFADAWSELSERALLAAADSDRGLTFVSNQQQRMESLVEPYRWRVDATLSNLEYPGTLRFLDLSPASTSMELTEPIANGYAPVPPTSNASQSALRGIQGSFEVVPTTNDIRHTPFSAANPFQFEVVAGSMQAKLETDGSVRDQRGLLRKPTIATAQWLRTPVGSPTPDTTLWTSLSSLSLDMGDFGVWHLWFKDLPVKGNSFDRIRSDQNEGVNDPAADSPQQNYQQGYEWRLSPSDRTSQLFVGPLPFFPLSLKKVTVAGDLLERVEFTGRLQLPLPTPEDDSTIVELEQDSNVVKVAFVKSGNDLVFESISAEACDELFGSEVKEIVWPLNTAEGSATLRGTDVRGLKDSITHKLKKIELLQARVDLSLFGLRWVPTVVDFTDMTTPRSIEIRP